MENWRTVEDPEEEQSSSSSSSDAELSSSRSRAIASSAMSCDWANPSICAVTSFAKSLTDCPTCDDDDSGAIVFEVARNKSKKLLVCNADVCTSRCINGDVVVIAGESVGVSGPLNPPKWGTMDIKLRRDPGRVGCIGANQSGSYTRGAMTNWSLVRRPFTLLDNCKA